MWVGQKHLLRASLAHIGNTKLCSPVERFPSTATHFISFWSLKHWHSTGDQNMLPPLDWARWVVGTVTIISPQKGVQQVLHLDFFNTSSFIRNLVKLDIAYYSMLPWMLNVCSKKEKYRRGRGGCEEKPENMIAVFLKDRSQEQTITTFCI